MRYDLAFFLCCCRSFLGADEEHETTTTTTDENGVATTTVVSNDFYTLLGVERDASPDEIKRAYKKQSLQMHPDKLAQRGQQVTAASQAKFTRMKEAYEVLSDQHKRETYDAIGERGMKWLEEPFSIDPQELAHNFATSSALDRSKIFAIFVSIAIAVLLLPILVCLHVDGAFGADASWFATLVPLWLWDAFILFYHSRVILMGPITRPDHISEEEWVDPLPMKKRIFSLVRFVLIVVFEFMVALKLDGIATCGWSVIFFPLYVWEATTLYKKWPLARMRIVTVEDLEIALGKPFSEFTPAEKELIGKRYSVVSSTTSPDFEAAHKLKMRARHDVIKSAFRVAFVLVLLVQLDGAFDWNWWLVFMPFWIMTILICYANYQAFAEVQKTALEKDPTLFGLKKEDLETGGAGYGAVGADGAASPDETSFKVEMTEEEKEELKAQVIGSSSRLCSKCFSQGFLLLVVLMFVGKIQGGGFSAVWIISPFLFVAGIILCCLGCAIFGITEVPTDGVDFDTGDFVSAAHGGEAAESSGKAAAASPIYMPPPPATTTTKPTATAATDNTTGQNETTAAAAAMQQQMSPETSPSSSMFTGPAEDDPILQAQGGPTRTSRPPQSTTTSAGGGEKDQKQQSTTDATNTSRTVDLLDDQDKQPEENVNSGSTPPPSGSGGRNNNGHVVPGEIHELD